LHIRQIEIATTAGPVIVIAGGPRRIVEAPLREAITPLLVSLLLLGSGLAFATWLQLRVGLRPLRKLRTELADVRAGAQRHIPLDQPEEILPLAIELNALIDQNEAGLAHARRHLSNLAHGLKTPLAALGLKLAEPGRDPDNSLGDMVRHIDGHIRHHLGRARAAAPGGGGRARTRLAPAVQDLVGVLQGIYAERPIAISTTIDANIAVAVDPRDLDEMVGNLLDNAWRYAASSIRIEAIDSGAHVELRIDDDGPGLSAEAILEAMVAGRRLDERGDGYGFGLSICRELAELNAGSVELLRSPATRGLRVRLVLPSSTAGETAHSSTS
jgi:signal transduction histidine kinase